MTHGQIGYLELYSKDLSESQSFFERVFGFKFESPMPEYLMFTDTVGHFSGGISADGPKWTAPKAGAHIYISVDSIEKSLAAIAEAGGKELNGKTLISENFGSWASFEDPSGNALGLYEATQKQ